MTHKFQTRQLITTKRATYVAPSQVPQGKSLEDEVFQSIFVNPRDFKPATRILQTAGQRSIYFDAKDAQTKIMQKFDEEVMKLKFNDKGNEIRREFSSDLFYSIAFNSQETHFQAPGSYIRRKNIQL